MSDVAAAKKLGVVPTIKDGIAIGAKNLGPILVNVLLWALTVWIPYLNVGTTIGLMVGIVSKASKGEPIDMTDIFDPKYRKYMGEFFLSSGLINLGVVAGLIFGIIPGIVISLAWSLTLLLVIDKGKNPTEALTISNNCTYGYKWRMVGIYLLVSIGFSLVSMILLGIGGATGIAGVIGFFTFITVLLWIFAIFVFIGIQASIYKQLTAEV
ncbi:MAG: hypothetical protein LBP74_05165 [Treponema sp.]|jgi:hypothetical protein|nr:hypothetical protein [Treponema sp.]